MNRHKLEERLFGFARWVSIGFFFVITAFPLLVMVALSVKPMSSVLRSPGNILPTGEDFSLVSYEKVLTARDEGGYGFLQLIQNTVFIAVSTVGAVLVFGVFAAYAATRLRYRGSTVINTLIIFIYLFPPLVFAVPLFVFFTRLGMRPSFTAVIIIYFAYSLPVGLYMLRDYFQSLPRDLEDAARIDGASRLQVIRHIVGPLSTPAIIAVGMYVFMAAWDEFLFALLFLVTDRESWTVSLGIHQLEVNGDTPATVLLAGCVGVTVPVLAVFWVAQRYLAEGLTAGGVKH